MNIRLLRRVQKAIKAHPDQFQMRTWYSQYLDADDPLTAPAGGCGTAACIAAWALHLHSKNKRLNETERAFKDVAEQAGKVLQIGEIRNRNHLFSTDGWPTKFLTQWYNANTAAQKAAVAIRRIDHFIKTKGAE